MPTETWKRDSWNNLASGSLLLAASENGSKDFGKLFHFKWDFL
jgi:hypothetical protein